MKVKFGAEQKKIITVAEVPEVKKMIAEMREYDESGDAAIIVRIASGSYNSFEILRFEAEIAKNQRVYNRYSDNSDNLDVWLTVYAFNDYDGFYTIGAYLSDVWESTGDNAEELRSHMWIRKYTRTEV